MSLFEDQVEEIYDAPSQSRGNEIAPPESSTFCIGHNAQESFFLEMYNNTAIPHAVIFSGLKGIGKTTFAFRLARFLLKHDKADAAQDALFGGDDLPQNATSLDVAGDDPVFARIASGAHADMLHIRREFDAAKNKQDATLKVDSLRRIEKFLRKTASEGGWRIVLVEDADTMNRNAQNAILKILEEPPPKVLIILVTHRPGLLIPTINSRARTVKFNPLNQENLNELLNKKGIVLSVDDMHIVTDMSEGSFGQALRIIEEGGLTSFTKVLDVLNTYPKWQWHKIHELSNKLAPSSQDKEYRMFAETLTWVFRKMLFVKARGQTSLPAYLTSPAMLDFFANTPLEKMVEISDGLTTHFTRTDFSNLDRRDAVRHAFTVIHQ